MVTEVLEQPRRIVAVTDQKHISNQKFKDEMSSHKPTTDILDRLKKLPADFPFLKIDCTPAMAMDLLSVNIDKQRIWDVNLLNMLKYVMKEGKFIYNGEPVIFSKKGRVLDGQHRLRACVESGVTITILIVCGVKDEAFHSMDQGKKRTADDLLYIQGYKHHSKPLAYAIKAVLQFKHEGKIAGGIKGLSVPSHLVMEFEKDEKRMIKMVEAVTKAFEEWHKASRWLSASQWAALYFILWDIPNSQKKADEFIDKLATGASISKADPIYKARTDIESILGDKALKKAGKSSRMALTMKFNIIFTAWNIWKSGQKVDKLNVKHGPKLVIPN